MRLNGWQRLGVIASIFWAIGGGIWINHLVIGSMSTHVTDWYETCRRAPHPEGPHVPFEATLEACSANFLKDYPISIANHGLYAAAYTALSILIGWATAYAILAIGRWVQRGFAQSN